ncbi:MAG: PIG-L family deacetylase [Candidatus Hodarchaeales archaeon]|jgi:bacillithiol biosynthesis deacetylase BshB1
MPEEPVEVVAIGAHPDDVELGVGGTIAKIAKSGIRTGIIDLTNAEPTPKNEKYRSPDDFDPDYADRRLAEAQEAARILGVKRMTMDLPNRRLFDDFEARCKLATIFRRWKPKVVIVMYGKTLMASPDHQQAQLITEAAIFYSRLTKWEKYMENLPVHRVTSLLYFPVRFIGLHPDNYTSFFVDISNTVDLKEQAILCYKSQGFDPDRKAQGLRHFPSIILSWNRTLGTRIGVEYAEHLVSAAPLRFDEFSYFLNK